MDKRDLAALFRERVTLLVRRKGSSQGAFAREIGLDRSAFSQMMSADGARLPRAETLRQIAEVNAVSADWLLGLSHDAEGGPIVSSRVAIEDEHDAQGVSPLERWHREAEGYKIRFSGSFVADVHQILHKGGVFTYPGFIGKEQGKLRLLFEANPMGFIVDQAGGATSNGKMDILSVQPEAVSQRIPIYIGGKSEINLIEKINSEV